jgi:putative Mg2+ transporter-C (MgtC) family protein
VEQPATAGVLQGVSTHLPWLDVLLRLMAASAGGLLLGLEREWKEKPAGLRTHMLVSLAAACFTILATEIFLTQVAITGETSVDTTRVIEGVIAGVAFLGAGTIIKGDGDIKGLTTGASIWVAGALGVACGGGYYAPALVTLGLALLALHVLGRLESRVRAHLPHEQGALPDERSPRPTGKDGEPHQRSSSAGAKAGSLSRMS